MGIKTVHVKCLSLILTVIAFLLSFPILFVIIWSFYIGHYDCEDILELPKLQTGITVGLILLFFISNIVIYLRTRLPVPGILVIMILLIVFLTIGLGLVGVFKMDSTPGSPLWIKTKVINKIHWANIKSCIHDTKICDDLAARADELVANDFPSSKICPTELGCCKPPSSCGMEHVNGTSWKKGVIETDDPNNHDPDCDLWDNDDKILCYNCHSCKHGFTRQLQRKWLKLGLFLVVLTGLLIIVHVSLFLVSMLQRYEDKE